MTHEDAHRGAERLRGSLQDPRWVTVADIHDLIDLRESKARHAAYAAMHAVDSAQWGYHIAAGVWCDTVLRRIHKTGPRYLRTAAGRFLGGPERQGPSTNEHGLPANLWNNRIQQY